MKKLWPVALLILGIMLICGGFTYDILFAGIPFQDPTPELAARYTIHANIAAFIRMAGMIVFVTGFLCGVFLLVRRRYKNQAV